jgi:hypothetical protein
MSNLQILYRTLDQLPLEELAQVQHYIEQRRQTLQHAQNNPARVAALQAALAEFRAGMTPSDWDVIAEAMNEEYIEPEDPDWPNHLPKDQP